MVEILESLTQYQL